MSMEEVRVPQDAIGFISIKAGTKFRGLVNVSGFHVDPGFSGRLKFSVYNPGNRPIVLEPGSPIFLLWFASLDCETEDVYKGDHQNQAEITPKDVMRLQGEVPSPAALDKRLREVEFLVKAVKTVVYLALAGLFGAVATVWVNWLLSGRGLTPSHKPPVITNPMVPQSQQGQQGVPKNNGKEEHLSTPESGRATK